ncbi:MAG: bifunctional riboflavin kinase/FAD synthetase [Pseudomonadota bacterium]
MKCLRHPDAIKRWRVGRPSVLTIGAYDGVHVGHQALLAEVGARARQTDALPIVMSFEPTPKEFFAGAQAPARITNFRERAMLFEQHGMGAFFCPRFDARMAAISVQTFIDDLLIDALGTRHLVIGDDFRFGQNAAGGVDDLRSAGFDVEQLGSVLQTGERVSSTAVRLALASGDMASVRRALGRTYELCGRVIRGQQLGRTLGYPTANIALHRRVSPVSGIFAVRVAGIAGSETCNGVASIGTRPTVGGEGVLLEVFVFDFSGDLYGQRLRVELVEKIRDEAHFDSLEALTEQMDDDSVRARRILAAA